MTSLRVFRPATMGALRAVMHDPGPVHPIAGGTDMLVAGRLLPDQGVLVDLSGLRELQGIDAHGIDIRIGPATTAAAIEADIELASRYPALVQAAAECGSVQIRNRATIGGNIANAAAACGSAYCRASPGRRSPRSIAV